VKKLIWSRLDVLERQLTEEALRRHKLRRESLREFTPYSGPADPWWKWERDPHGRFISRFEITGDNYFIAVYYNRRWSDSIITWRADSVETAD